MISPVDRPIETVSDIVDYVLCDDNDSLGVILLRGWAYTLQGQQITQDELVALGIGLAKDDPPLFEMMKQVSRATIWLPHVVIMQVANRLSVLYWERGQREGLDRK